MKLKTFLMKATSKIYKKIFKKPYYDCMPGCIYERQQANDLLYEALKDGKPFMLTRYGSIEMCVTNSYRMRKDKRNVFCKLWEYVTDKTDMPWYDELFYLPISRNAGVFNPTPKILDCFAQRYLQDSEIIDVLMSVNYKERFMPLKESCQFIHFESVYPYFVKRPWTRILKGKKVLVVHPYADTIQKQYAIREKLYDNPEILPVFELKTLKAVQSSAFAEVPFKDWFEALEYMENEIDKIDFDICLLGCGAYGLPLAAHVKRLGKQAIHMGAGVQLLFGICGRRWEEEYVQKPWGHNTPFCINTNYVDLKNEYWTRPSGNEILSKSKSVEGGCYW
ncbi:hypothetical protein AB9N12_16085 [Bacteroides sp. AN502(2024)]|uniref:GT-D fold domain-containing protein n=1 Tax=Bacteroides sp. AN502(2024) TaxID=3160599 RepID=UPI003511E7DB